MIGFSKRLPFLGRKRQRQKAQLHGRPVAVSLKDMDATTTRSTSIRLLSGLDEIDKAIWDACANPGWAWGSGAPDRARSASASEPAPERRPYNPFLSWDFLEALERSGSVSAKTGWAPRHAILVEDGTADPVARPTGAVMPCYAKSHS